MNLKFERQPDYKKMPAEQRRAEVSSWGVFITDAAKDWAADWNKVQPAEYRRLKQNEKARTNDIYMGLLRAAVDRFKAYKKALPETAVTTLNSTKNHNIGTACTLFIPKDLLSGIEKVNDYLFSKNPARPPYMMDLIVNLIEWEASFHPVNAGKPSKAKPA
jgi:hypothetical protein